MTVKKTKTVRVNPKERSKDFMTEFLNQFQNYLPITVKNQPQNFILNHVQSKSQFYDMYVFKCNEKEIESVSRKKLVGIFEEKNFSLFSPKNYQCDLCMVIIRVILKTKNEIHILKIKTEIEKKKKVIKKSLLLMSCWFPQWICRLLKFVPI